MQVLCFGVYRVQGLVLKILGLGFEGPARGCGRCLQSPLK